MITRSNYTAIHKFKFIILQIFCDSHESDLSSDM